MNIYVANIPFKATDDQLRTLFAEYGEVSSAKIITDKFTQQSRGFGFVTFETEASIQRVVSHGAHRLKGSTIAIDIAMPKVGGWVGHCWLIGSTTGVVGEGSTPSSSYSLVVEGKYGVGH